MEAMERYAHINLPQSRVYNGPLRETCVRSANSTEVGEQLCHSIAFEIVCVHVRQVTIVSLAREDEERVCEWVKDH